MKLVDMVVDMMIMEPDDMMHIVPLMIIMVDTDIIRYSIFIYTELYIYLQYFLWHKNQLQNSMKKSYISLINIGLFQYFLL